MLIEAEIDDIVFQKQEVSQDKIVSRSIKSFTSKTILFSQHSTDFLQIPLNQSGTSYLTLEKIPEDLRKLALSNFKEIWELHPSAKHKIIHAQRQSQVFRYSKSYLNTPTNLDHLANNRSYMYSGYDTSQNRVDLPKNFEPFYEQMKKKDQNFNQVIANWYEKRDYIAFHSDCEIGMIQNAKVAILSLYPSEEEENFRFLELIAKKDKGKSLFDKFVVRLDHGLIVTMHGDCQKQFKHGIRKERRVVSERVSLSFRQMKKQLYDQCK